MQKEHNKEWIYLLLLSMAAIVVSFSCHSFGLLNELPERDSSVFQYIADEMIKGKMPYLDTFDHKGPLIYLFNVAGKLLSDTYGLWFIELLALAATLFLCYFIARLCAGSFASMTAGLLCALSLCPFLQSGNLVEEYAMPFIAYSIYVYLAYFKYRKTSALQLLLCGCCFGAVLMLRPNMIAVWIVGCLAVVIDCLWDHKTKKLPGFIALFAVGILIVIIPFLIWLYMGGALQDFWKDYILFNLSYKESKSSLFNIAKVIAYFILNFGCLMALFSMILAIRKKHSICHFMVLGFLVVSFALMGISGRLYAHYAMVIIPVLAYPFAYISTYITDFTEKNKKTVEIVVSVILLIGGMTASIDPVKKIIREVLPVQSSWKEKYPEEAAVVSEIQHFSDEYDKITVYGNHDAYYLLSGRDSASKYSYQKPLVYVDKRIKTWYFKDLQESMPAVIVWCNYNASERTQKDSMYQFIIENHYIQSDKVKTVFYRN